MNKAELKQQTQTGKLADKFGSIEIEGKGTQVNGRMEALRKFEEIQEQHELAACIDDMDC